MLVIFDKKTRTEGVKEYLQNGTYNDRDEKDKRVALVGNLELTDKVAELGRKKGYKETYRNIVLSFEEDLDEKILENITKDFIRLYMQPYNKDEYTAYAEAHLPKKKINSRGYERKKHTHIVIATYSLKLQHQLDLGNHAKRLAEIKKIKEYLEAKYNLKSVEQRKIIKEDKAEILNIAKYSNRNQAKKELEKYIKDNIAHYEKLDDLISDLEKKLNATIKKSKKAKTPYISIKLPNFPRAIRLKGELFSDKSFKDAREQLLKNSKYISVKQTQRKDPAEILQELEELQAKRKARVLKRIKNKRLQQEQELIKKEQTQKMKNYISYAEKELNKIYNYNFNLNLPKYFFVRRYENTGYTIITNKKKNIKVLDKGNKIVATGSNLEEQAKIMIELAVAKGWDLSKVRVTGDEEFKKIATKLIQEKIRELNNNFSSPSLANASVNKEIQPSSYTQSKLREAKEQQQVKELDLRTLKEVLTAEELLKALKDKGLLAKDYQLENNRIIIGKKKLNIVDFCLKEMNLSFKETSKLLNDVYNANLEEFKGEKMETKPIDWKQIKRKLHPLTIAKYYKIDIKPEQISKKNDEYRIKVGKRNYNVVDYLLKEQKMSFKDITANIDNLMKLQQQFNIEKINKQIKLDEKAKAELARKEQLKIINDAKQEDLSIFLANMGYKVDKTKSCRNYRVMKDDNGDKVIIYKNKDDRYLYFNPQNDQDKGDLYNFFANRGIKSYKGIVDIIKGADRNIDLQPLAVAKKPYQIDKALEDYNNYYKNKEHNDYSYLTEKRMLDENIIKAYSHSIKSDKYGNIIVPLYLKGNKFMQVGYDRRLKEKKEDQPKSYINGKKGLGILQPKDFKQVENVVICENYIDGLSYIEINQLDPNTTAIISTQGTLNKEEKESIKAYMDIAKKYSKINNIVLAMDNDEAGKKMSNTIKEELTELKDILKEETSQTKDFNEDLKIYKNIINEAKKEEVELSIDDVKDIEIVEPSKVKIVTLEEEQRKTQQQQHRSRGFSR